MSVCPLIGQGAQGGWLTGQLFRRTRRNNSRAKDVKRVSAAKMERTEPYFCKKSERQGIFGPSNQCHGCAESVNPLKWTCVEASKAVARGWSDTTAGPFEEQEALS